jgi:hypothetical protein
VTGAKQGLCDRSKTLTCDELNSSRLNFRNYNKNVNHTVNQIYISQIPCHTSNINIYARKLQFT